MPTEYQIDVSADTGAIDALRDVLTEFGDIPAQARQARDEAQAAAEQAATAAAADTLLFFVSQTATSARVVTAARAVVTNPGPGPYPSVTLEII